jgi:hypothetical protein
MEVARMIRIASQPKPATPEWHEVFLKMAPAIVTHAKIAFGNLRAEARAEAVQNVLCSACAAVARLAELNKLDLCYPTVLAKFAVSQTRDGRMLGRPLNCKDISSSYCRRLKGLALERLDHFDREENAWAEVLVEDRHCGPFDIVRTKLDFAAWLRSLPIKLRRIAKTLASGQRTGDVARKFGLSDGRISQIRSELLASWRCFVGEAEPPEGATVPA